MSFRQRKSKSFDQYGDEWGANWASPAGTTFQNQWLNLHGRSNQYRQQPTYCMCPRPPMRTTLSARFSPEEHDIATIMTASMGKGSMPSGKTTTVLALHTERSFFHDHEFIHMTMEMQIRVPVWNKRQVLCSRVNGSTHIFVQSRGASKETPNCRTAIAQERPSIQTKKHFIEALFERTKYHIPIDVRTEAISSLTVSDIQKFHQKWIKSSASTYVTMVTPTLEAASTLGKILPAHQEQPNTTLSWSALPRVASEKHIKLPGYGSFQIMMGQTFDAKPLTKNLYRFNVQQMFLGVV